MPTCNRWGWLGPGACEESDMSDVVLTICRAAVTVGLFVLFVALIFWAWSPRRRDEFREAGNLVFDESDTEQCRSE